AAWITEDVVPRPRNVYGVTKTAAEDLCELVHRDHGLPVLILRTSRFFPEPDDRDEVRTSYLDLNLKVNELLYRRVDLAAAAPPRPRARRRRPRRGRHPTRRPPPTPGAGGARPPRARPGLPPPLFPGWGGDCPPPRLEAAPGDGARVRQRPRPPRPRLDAA